MKIDLLGTPILYDTCQKSLLRIVSYVRSNAIYSISKMAIGATHNFRCGHAWFERFEHLRQRRMEKLAAKLTEFRVVSVFFICYNDLINHSQSRY